MLAAVFTEPNVPARARLRAAHLFVLLLIAGFAASCGGDAGAPPSREQFPFTEPEALAQERREREQEYATSPDSPIPEDRRDAFEGLEFYPYDPELRFVVRLDRYEDPEPVTLVTTGGELRPAVKAGQVQFEHAGEQHSLQVYELRDASVEQWGSLFLPFMDATTGDETYGAGRYIELVPGPNDWYGLDFNETYNPLCAYGRSGYVCPRTPEENRLPFPVRAGEKGPDLHGEATARDAPAADEGGGAA
jgi:hypothetical protein